MSSLLKAIASWPSGLDMCSTMTICTPDERFGPKASPARPQLGSRLGIRPLGGYDEAPVSLSGGRCSETQAGEGLREGLAARRRVRPSFVKTSFMQEDFEERGVDQGKKLARSKRHLQRIVDIEEHYALGEEVFPCAREDMRVVKGTSLETGEQVIVKMRRKAGFEDPNEEIEFRDTATLVLNLPGTHSIARVFEVLESADAYYVVMEKVDGLDLFETLSAEGHLEICEVKEIIRQLLRALAELHAKGYVHKDVKLENVMYSRSPSSPSSSSNLFSLSGKLRMPSASSSPNLISLGGVHAGLPDELPVPAESSSGTPSSLVSPTASVKLIDFDTIAHEQAGNVSEDDITRTRTGRAILGTDQYLAPEAYRGQYSQHSDVFSVGVVSYLLLTGYFPFSESIFSHPKGDNFVGSPSMEEVRVQLLKYKVDWTKGALQNDLEARSFVSAMLSMNRWNRPSAKEALNHPWLAERAMSDPPCCEEVSRTLQESPGCRPWWHLPTALMT